MLEKTFLKHMCCHDRFRSNCCFFGRWASSTQQQTKQQLWWIYSGLHQGYSIFSPKACILQHVDSWGSQAFINFIKNILMKKVAPSFESKSTAGAFCLSMRGLPKELIQNRSSSQWISSAQCLLTLSICILWKTACLSFAFVYTVATKDAKFWSAANGEY